MPNTLKYRVQHETKTLTTGQVTTIQIPPYGKIHDLVLSFTTAAGAAGAEADIRSEIANIRLTINGVDHVNCSPTQLLDLYESLSGSKVGSPAGIAGAVELNIGRLVMTDPLMRNAFGFGTADVQTIQVAVTAGTLANIANVQGFTQRTRESEKLGVRCKYLSYQRNFNATGEDTFDTLPRDPDTSYLALMVNDGASGTITTGQVKVDNVTVQDPAPQAINNQLLSNNGYQAVAGYYIYSFMDSSPYSRLPMVNVADFRITTNFSVAAGAAGYAVAALSVIGLPANF